MRRDERCAEMTIQVASISIGLQSSALRRRQYGTLLEHRMMVDVVLEKLRLSYGEHFCMK